MWRIVFIMAVATGGLFTGCITVDTPDTHVSVGPTHVFSGPEESPAVPQTAYARPLRRVSSQHTRLVKELHEGDWGDLAEASGKWVEYVRELAGYAETSHDPPLFREYCRQLAGHADAAYQASIRRDPSVCRSALDASSSLLSRFMDSFPLTVPEAQAAARRSGREGSASPPSRSVRVP